MIFWSPAQELLMRQSYPLRHGPPAKPLFGVRCVLLFSLRWPNQISSWTKCPSNLSRVFELTCIIWVLGIILSFCLQVDSNEFRALVVSTDWSHPLWRFSYLFVWRTLEVLRMSCYVHVLRGEPNTPVDGELYTYDSTSQLHEQVLFLFISPSFISVS